MTVLKSDKRGSDVKGRTAKSRPRKSLGAQSDGGIAAMRPALWDGFGRPSTLLRGTGPKETDVTAEVSCRLGTSHPTVPADASPPSLSGWVCHCLQLQPKGQKKNTCHTKGQGSRVQDRAARSPWISALMKCSPACSREWFRTEAGPLDRDCPTSAPNKGARLRAPETRPCPAGLGGWVPSMHQRGRAGQTMQGPGAGNTCLLPRGIPERSKVLHNWITFSLNQH